MIKIKKSNHKKVIPTKHKKWRKWFNTKSLFPDKPKDQRDGQFLFNLLQWMKLSGIDGGQNNRLADTFHMSDDTFRALYKKFLEEHQF